METAVKNEGEYLQVCNDLKKQAKIILLAALFTRRRLLPSAYNPTDSSTTVSVVGPAATLSDFS